MVVAREWLESGRLTATIWQGGMETPQILICGESGGNGRTCQLAERFGSCDPFAERES